MTPPAKPTASEASGRGSSRRGQEGRQPACEDLLKTLADSTRLGVVELLLDRPQQVGELNTVLKVEPTLLSHHLRILREAGVIVARRRGKALEYRLSDHVKARRAKGIDLGCCVISFR